jgi:hypothetical protein
MIASATLDRSMTLPPDFKTNVNVSLTRLILTVLAVVGAFAGYVKYDQDQISELRREADINKATLVWTDKELEGDEQQNLSFRNTTSDNLTKALVVLGQVKENVDLLREERKK